ncbi:protein FAM117B-like [Topomyia yanbarensis]|uniref:protein FAM117B-like n=1 Tax=Topomyia yanbarensis TaxID=2498891 RepID=UPI00273B796F|nr:protein FAM117B-like [Topomyia yanbarensis]
MSSRVRKQNEPMKAFVPVSSLLVRGTGSLQCATSGGGGIGSKSLSATLSPPIRHISPEHAVSGNRSPGALTYKGKLLTLNEGSMRRTASLDALYLRPVPTWNQAASTLLQLDKATQTDESFLERTRGTTWMPSTGTGTGPSVDASPVITRSDVTTPTDLKMEKVIRQRLQRTHRGEHSVSSQTLSPNHAKASPVSIPSRTCPPVHMRPMRSSVEGLNQEIEKLVLYTGQSHACRSDLEMYSRGTPEGHRAPLAELFHAASGGSATLTSDTRSVNTQTPLGDTLSSDEGSQSTSPDEGAAVTSASPRINRFLAREPPDGCEKVNLKLTEADTSTNTTHFKPCVAFQLRPSLGSAFQPLQPMPTLKTTPEDDGNAEEGEATLGQETDSTK